MVLKRPDFAAIRARIMADAESQFYYLNAWGQTCVLGDLGRQAGVPDETLRAAEQTRIDYTGKPLSGDPPAPSTTAVAIIASAIEGKFGLSPIQQRSLQTANDNWDTTEARRHALLVRLETLESRKQNANE